MGSDASLPSPRRDPLLLCMWALGPICASIYSLIHGRHDGADYLNVRWFLGWLIVNDPEGVPSRLHSLTVRPFFNEIFMGVLTQVDFWWFPVVIVGALHGTIPPLLYQTCRSLCPQVRSGVAALASLLSLATPLTSVHIGRENGHLLAALCMVIVVRHVVSRPEKVSPSKAAFLLNLALFLKYSSVFSVAVVAVFVLTTLSLGVALKFVRSFVACLWTFTLVHSALRWPSLDSTEIVLQPWSVTRGWFFVLGLAIILTFFHTPKRLMRTLFSWPSAEIVWHRSSPFIMPLFALVLLSLYSFTQIFGDPRFYTDSATTIVRRLASNGMNLGERSFGSDSLYDLEYTYFDLSKIVASLTLLVAIGLILSDVLTRRQNRHRVLLFSSIPGSVLVLVMAHYGYVRYVAETLLLLPVAVVALGHSLNVGRKTRSIAVVLPLLLLVLPISGLQEWRGYFDDDPHPRSGPLLTEEEITLLSGLVPYESTVIFLSRDVSWVAPVIDRKDLVWSVGSDVPNDRGRSSATVFFDPSRYEELQFVVDRGWLLSDCQVLRFELMSAGWCSITAANVGSLS